MSCNHHDDGLESVKRNPAEGLADAWQRLKDDTHARLVEGVDVAKAAWHDHGSGTHSNGYEHGHNHDHKAMTTHETHKAHAVNLPKEGEKKGHWAYKKIGNVGKAGIILGATISIGVAIHGIMNIKNGIQGEHDKNLDEQREPSTYKMVVGAAEVAGGMALLKRALTGRFRF